MEKSGRPRRYDLEPVRGVANRDVGLAIAALDELSARLCDLIGDLDQAALDFVPHGTTNSISMLVVHMAWAEASWIVRVTRFSIAADLEARLLPGKQTTEGVLVVSSYSSSELVSLCQQVRYDVTIPALSTLEDIDFKVPDPRRPMTIRGVLMHLIWHWTYHSGQVGLLRRMWGARYQWTFDDKIGVVPSKRENEVN